MTDKLTRTQAIRAAEEMWADGDGWNITEIRRYLAERGVHVSWHTARGWADPQWKERRLAYQRGQQRRWKREQSGTTEFRVLDGDAMERLRMAVGELPPPSQIEATPDLLLALRLEDGLPYPAIAAVARRFMGEDLTPDQWRERLNKLGAPKNAKKAANARAQSRRRQIRVAA